MTPRRVAAGVALVVAGAAAGIAVTCRQPAPSGRRITLTEREAAVALEGLDDGIALRCLDLAESAPRSARIIAARQSAGYAGLSAVIESRLRALDN